jgi:hypothetical protein
MSDLLLSLWLNVATLTFDSAWLLYLNTGML